MPMPLLSICVPSYNGAESMPALVESLLRSERADFEIVVCDDCSGDGTWPLLQSIAARDARLRIARNESNLGMDRNFARTVELARGTYVWFCGQDDMIEAAGLSAVLEYLDANERTDFIYLSHSKRVQTKAGDRLVEAAPLAQHVRGQGLRAFLAQTGNVLPTFLPTYILRKGLWDNVEVSRYIGTCYCQVGVFIEASEKMEWCCFAGSFVIGLLPQEGWQYNPKAYARIALGHVAMVARAAARAPWLDEIMIGELYRMQRRRLIYAFMLCRRYRLEAELGLTGEVLSAIDPYADVARPLALIRALPRWASSMLFHAIEFKRFLRGLFAERRS